MPASRTPRLSEHCDIRSLPIDPREAFLLSRIDGVCSEAELALLTGLDLDAVRASLDRLIALGAVTVEERIGESPISMPRLPLQPPYSPSNAPSTERPGAGAGSAAPDDREDEPCDLDLDHRRRVRALVARLDELDYYALLGVPPNADRKDVKKAYHEQAPEFHPDRFFGKRLGSYKPQMEAIFARMTLAYETIRDRERREEYDAYLATRQQTRAMEQALASGTELPRGDSPSPAPPRTISGPAPPRTISGVTVRPVEIREKAPAASTTVNGGGPAGPGAAAPKAPSGRPPAPAGQVGPSSPPPRTTEDERARRAAFARRLGGTKLGASSAPPGVAPSGPVSARTSSVPSSASAALEDLVRRRDSSAAEARKLQVRRYVDAAQQALAANNLAAAANAYRLARTLDPDDPELAAATEKATKAAAVALAAGYRKQAEYEEREGRMQDAARSYVKAASGMPQSSEVHEKAAKALVKAGGDLHQAVDLARRAVALEPRRLSARLTLAEVYIAAGLDLAARRELDAARQLGPQDGRIQELAKLLR